MKAELDALRERGAEAIRTAAPNATFLTTKHGIAICYAAVDALEAQCELMKKDAKFGGQKWGTVGQLAKKFGMSASGVRSMIKRMTASGYEVRRTNPNAIPGHPMHTRYRIVDVEIGRKLLEVQRTLFSGFRK